MSRSSPQALALREPAAVLLLVSVAGAATGELLALDASARAAAGVAEGEPPPRDLRDFLRRAGLVADPVWERLERGEVVAGARLPGDLWVSAGRVPDHDQLLVVVVRTHAVDHAGHDDARGVVAAGPGTALSALREGHLVVDWVDGAFTRTTGAAAHDVLGRSWEELLSTRDEAALADLTRSVSLARPTTVTVLDHRGDGTAFLHEVRTVPLLDRTGAVRHVVSRHSDVTRRTAEASATDHTADHTAERTAERRAATRLEVLGRLDAVVLDEDVTHGIRSVVRVLGDHLVSAAMVALLREGPGGGATEVEVVAAHGPGLHGLVGHRTRRSRQAGPDPLLDPAAPDTGEPLEIAALDAPPGTAAAWLAELTAGTPALALPLRGREHVVGVLVVVPHPGGTGPEDRTVLAGAARRAGLLVENERLHAREHALAETLQRSMLPDATGLDGIEGLDVWTFYASNAEHAQVGGDWYDVLPPAVDGGGQHVAGIVVGDVVGHDVEAAAAMGQIRSVVRSAAHELDDPASVLMRVDQLTGGMRIPRMASLVYATLQRLDDGGWEMAWSSAGHLPPLLRRGNADPRAVEVLSEATGTLVGLGERPRPTRERALAPGDVLVFYTDGLIETRARPVHDGLEVLVGVLAASRARDAAGIGEELLSGLGDTPEDDTAIVVVRVPEESEAGGGALPTADTPRRRRWQLPSEPSSIGKARHATLRACAVWGLQCGPQAEIVVSELVANAVLHGWGTIGLRLFDLPGALRLEVEDDSPEEPQVVEARPDGGGGHGMRLVASLGRWGTTRTRRGKIVWVEIPTAPKN